MIELILFVALGFLVAALLGLIVAPAIYRRVVKLTERRMRATVPLNAAEIKAAKDMERAAFAAENARISVELRSERELLSKEKAGSSKLSDTIVKMRSQNEELRDNVDTLKEESGKLRSKLRTEENKLEQTRDSLKNAQESNIEKEKQILSLIDKANRLSTDVGSLKIDLASKDTEAENLKSTIDGLRHEHKKIRAQQSELETRAQKLGADLKREQTRANELDRKLNSATVKLANREQTLENKNSEIARLKERMNSVKTEGADLKKSLRASETERRALERRLSKAEKQLSTYTGKPIPERKSAVVPKRNSARKTTAATKKVEKLEIRTLSASEIASRVDKLRQRHNSLVEHLNLKETTIADNELRRELAEIAAMMIDLTAAREGAKSPIHKQFSGHVANTPTSDVPPSLADRAIRRIEKTNRASAN